MENTEAAAMRDIAISTADTRFADMEKRGKPFVLVPHNYRVEDLEKLLPQPRRKTGSPTFNDVQSFIRYVNTHKTDDTIVLANITETSGSFLAVLDYHGKEQSGAAWREHQAKYPCPMSPEWKRWIGSDKKQMSQNDFAIFLEDNLLDVVRPEGAEMLEIAKTLQASKAGRFKSGIRLENGDHELQYEETTQAKAGQKGTLEIPSTFDLGLSCFTNGKRYKVEARLRYRINEGALIFWYELVRPHLIIDDACKELIAQIKAETGIQPLLGTL